MKTNTTASELLTEFKEYFITLLQHMSLEDIDEDWAEDLLTQRYFSEFESSLETLFDNKPFIDRCQSKQLKNDVLEIYKNIPKQLNHELGSYICEDFELIATYLIGNKDDKYIAGMCLTYADGNIPMLVLEPANKSLQDAYLEFKMKMKIGETLEKFIHNRADDKF